MKNIKAQLKNEINKYREEVKNQRVIGNHSISMIRGKNIAINHIESFVDKLDEVKTEEVRE